MKFLFLQIQVCTLYAAHKFIIKNMIFTEIRFVIYEIEINLDTVQIILFLLMNFIIVHCC